MPDKAYYKSLGFICGLEIHQRLATKEKLFCSCSAAFSETKPIAQIRRRQRAVAGELGVIDASTSFEGSKNRQFIYNIYSKETCLVDIDEEPPHELNKEALQIALEIAAAFNMKVPDELEPMRKVVVDGSDPTSFQRTILVGYDGYVEVNGKRISIPSLFLEEESSGINENEKERAVYDTNRLGIPLVEIDTAPEISTPEEAKEVAKQIGLILRLTGKVQRGIGTIRQDVNVSIKEGARVEIKGFQDLDLMPEIIDSEIQRQLNLIQLISKLKKNKASVGEAKDITFIFDSTNVGIIKKSLEAKGVVLGAKLSGFAGILGSEVNPGRRLGSEISDYAKLAGVGGVIHSDEDLSKYGFSQAEINDIKTALEIGEKDAFLIITGPPGVCDKAMAYALQRAETAIREVPKETRVADSKQKITKFLRPLPGGSRMYPETDAKPIEINKMAYEELLKNKVDVEKIEKELEKEIGNKELAEQMLWSPMLPLYNELVEKTGVEGSAVANVLLQKYPELRRRGANVDEITPEALEAIFEQYKLGKITKAAIEIVLSKEPKDRKEVMQAIREERLERITGKELEKLVEGYIASNKGARKEELIRKILEEHRINIDATELSNLLNKRIR